MYRLFFSPQETKSTIQSASNITNTQQTQVVNKLVEHKDPATESSKCPYHGVFSEKTTKRAGRSARYDRRVRNAEAAGSNPARSTVKSSTFAYSAYPYFLFRNNHDVAEYRVTMRSEDEGNNFHFVFDALVF